MEELEVLLAASAAKMDEMFPGEVPVELDERVTKKLRQMTPESLRRAAIEARREMSKSSHDIESLSRLSEQQINLILE